MLKGAAHQSAFGANNGKIKLQEGLLSITKLPVLLMSTGVIKVYILMHESTETINWGRS